MLKVLIEYSSYGKRDNEKECDRVILTSEQELNEWLIENWQEDLIGKFDFDSLETQTEFCSRDGVDWDEPTGFKYELMTVQSAKLRLNNEIRTLQDELNKLISDAEKLGI